MTGVHEIEAWDKVHRERQWGTCPEPAMARFMMRRFGAMLRRPCVLDLGCGAGAQTLWLAMNSVVVDAVDASPAAIERAERFVTQWTPYSGARFQVADARKLPFVDDFFDAVIDACTLQHVVDGHEKAVSEAFRVLRPGGWLFSMWASWQHSIEAFGGILTVALTMQDVDRLIEPLSKQVIVEEYQHTDRGMTISHWAIEAQKA